MIDNKIIAPSDIKEMFGIYEDRIRKDRLKEILNRKPSSRSLVSTITRELSKRDMNEIAIRVGVALAQMKTKPKWNVEDIINALESKNFIDKELIPFLSANYVKDKKLSNAQIKELARRIQKNIVQNERATIENVRNIIKTERSGKIYGTFAHQLNRQQLQSIRDSIINSIAVLKKTLENFQISDYLNYDPDNVNDTMVSFFLKLMGGKSNSKVKSLATDVWAVLSSLKDLSRNGEIKTDEGNKRLNKWIDILIKAYSIFNKIVKKNVLWPESKGRIYDIESLIKYFNNLEIEREKAQRVIQMYKHRLKDIYDIPTGDESIDNINTTKGWSDKKVEQLVIRTAKNMVRNKKYIMVEPDELIQDANKMAEELCAQMPGLAHFIENEHPDYISELASRIASYISTGKALRGRPAAKTEEELEKDDEFV